MVTENERVSTSQCNINSIVALIFNIFSKFTELNLSIKFEYTSDNVLVEC